MKETARQTVDFTATLDEGHDDNALPLAASTSGPGSESSAYQTSGFYTALSPAVAFESRGKTGKTQLRASAASDFRYYNDLGKTVALDHNLFGGVNADVGRRTIIAVDEAASYEPASLGGLFVQPTDPTADQTLPPDSANVPAANYALHAGRLYRSLTNGSLGEKITARGTLWLNSDFSTTRYVDKALSKLAGFSDLTSYHVGGRFDYHLDRNVELRLGYTYGRATYASSLLHVDEHDAEIGINYQRSLSATRKMTIEAAVGSTLFGFVSPPPATLPPATQPPATQPPATEPAPSEVATPTAPSTPQNRRLGTTGTFTLTRDISRTWSTSANYLRGIFYVAGLRNAIYSDTVTLGTQGFVNRRVDLVFAGSYSSGSFLLTDDQSSSGLIGNQTSKFTTYTGNVQAHIALVRTWAAYIDFLHYYYHFNNPVDVPSAFPATLTRNSLRAGLTLWVPIMRRH